MDAGDGLASVTYLPGVTPPPERSLMPDTSTRRAGNVSIRALTRRDLSRWELEQTLRKRGLDDDTVAAELGRIETAGLIDDAALAEMLVKTRHERKGLGRSALAAELRRRHIDQRHIDAALTQIDDDDERSTARDLAVARAQRLRGVDRETAARRLSGFLMRKGYSSDIVRAAVREALPQESSPEWPGVSPGVRFD